MTEKFGRLALHMWTIDTTPLATALDAAKQAGYDAVELRRTDFKRCFDAGMSNAQVLDLINKSGIPVGVLGVEYGWLFATGEESKRLFKVFRESCENAVALGCNMLMSAPGQVSGPIKDAIKYLREAGDIAAEYKLRLAIEFNSQHDVLNSLGVLTELIEGANKPNCGYLIDAYHFTRSGAGGRGFESVPADQIFCFQYSDLSPNPVTGVRRPTDRLPPGKGVVKWREMLGLLAEKGYTGYLSYEAPNPEQWARSPYDVAREGVELTRKAAERFRPQLRKIEGLAKIMIMANEETMTDAKTTDPLFAGLNDKSITAIPATVEKQRYMTSVAPKAANPGKWVEQPRLPIPTGEHAVIECQGKIHVIAGYARHRVDGNFHQVFDSKSRHLVAEGAVPAAVQSRGRRLDRLEGLHLRRLHRTEPLPAFQVLRL